MMAKQWKCPKDGCGYTMEGSELAVRACCAYCGSEMVDEDAESEGGRSGERQE